MPKLSVLLPARNASATIKIAIRSTLAAMPRDSELVIFNDGSTDSTATLLEEIIDSRLRIMTGTRTEGSGVANALNTLLENTDSEIVARMDADDITLPYRFRLQQRQIRSSVAQVVFGTVVHFGSGYSVPRPSKPERVSVEAMPLALLISNPVAHSTMFAVRGELEKVGGYKSGPAEDYELWLRLVAQQVPIQRGAIPVIAYRHHARQVTANIEWLRKARLDPVLNSAYRRCLTSVLGVQPQEEVNSDPLDQSQYSDELAAKISDLPYVHDRKFLKRYMKDQFAGTLHATT